MPNPQRTRGTASLSESIYEPFGALLGSTRWDEEVQDQMMREFNAGREGQIETWADRVTDTSGLSASSREAVAIAHKRRNP